MATWEDVREIALGLPGTEETRSREKAFWRVKGKGFVWERPLNQTDLRALGDAAPAGAILGARVEHLGAKEALLQGDPSVFFTIPHFDGYSAVLIRLERIRSDQLREVIVDAWLARAPDKLADAYVAEHAGGDDAPVADPGGPPRTV